MLVEGQTSLPGTTEIQVFIAVRCWPETTATTESLCRSWVVWLLESAFLLHSLLLELSVDLVGGRAMGTGCPVLFDGE